MWWRHVSLRRCLLAPYKLCRHWRSCSASFANQRCIIFFAVLKVLTGFHIDKFYFEHPAVGELAMPGASLVVFGAVGALRMWCGLVGFWGSLLRKVDTMRLFFTFLIVDLGGTLFTMAPVFRLECRCQDYYQCAALFSFLPKWSSLINPFPKPGEPPRIHGGVQNESAYDLFEWGHDGPEASTSITGLRVQQPSLAGAEHPADNFTVTPPGLRWKSTKNTTCWRSNASELSGMPEKLGRAELSYAQLLVVTNASWAYLDACLTSAKCAVVEVSYADRQDPEAGGPIFDACFHWFPALPVKDSPLYPQESLFFQKKASVANEVVVRRDRAIRLEEPPPVTQFMPTLSKAAGRRMLGEAFSNVCRCKAGDMCHLRQFGSETRHWCRVDEASVWHCIQERIEVLRIGDVWWSWMLCAKRRCRCSGVGRIPVPQKEPLKHPEMVWPNGINFGRSCHAWLADETQPWCFVGLDTTCVDARRQSMIAHDEQWRSTFACVEEEQRRYYGTQAGACVFARLCLRHGMVVLGLVNLLMVRVVYLFISNQCGDSFRLPEQYCSDDSESQDDFDVTTTPQGLARLARKRSRRTPRRRRTESASRRSRRLGTCSSAGSATVEPARSSADSHSSNPGN